MNHLGIQVTDLEGAVERLVSKGWTPRPIKTDGPLTYAMVEGPDRLLLEIFSFDAATLDPALRPYFDLDGSPVDSGLVEPGAGTLSGEARARLARPPLNPLQLPDISDLDGVAQWRERIHQAWLDGDPTATECGFQEVMVGGFRCLHAITEGQEPSGPPPPVIVYFHGGGFALGSPEVALPITERLAKAGDSRPGVDVVSVNYRLAPEHPYPAAVEDGKAVYRAIVAAEPDRRPILAGDSAGANLALSVAIRLMEANDVPMPGGLILLSPHLSHVPDHHAADDPRSDVDAAAAAWLSSAYLAETPPDDPGASPLLGSLPGLPPTLLQVGTLDGSLNQSIRFARRARAAGVDMTLDVWEGLWHTWHYHRDLPEADQALDEAAVFAHRCASAVPLHLEGGRSEH